MFGDPQKKDYIFSKEESSIHRLYCRIKDLNDFFSPKVW